MYWVKAQLCIPATPGGAVNVCKGSISYLNGSMNSISKGDESRNPLQIHQSVGEGTGALTGLGL
jgi:hypothetical protein